MYSSLRESASFKVSFMVMCHTVQIMFALTILAGISPFQAVFDDLGGMAPQITVSKSLSLVASLLCESESFNLLCVEICHTIQKIFSLTVLAGISLFRVEFCEEVGKNDP